MSADYKKKKRSAFWEPYETIIAKTKVCAGWDKYPSVGDGMETFDTRLTFLQKRVKPLLNSLKKYLESEQNLLFYSLRGSDITKSEQVAVLKKSIKSVWQNRDKGKPGKETPDDKVESGSKKEETPPAKEKKSGKVQASKKPERKPAAKTRQRKKATPKDSAKSTGTKRKKVSGAKKSTKSGNRTSRTGVAKSKAKVGVSKTKTVSKKRTSSPGKNKA